MAKEVNRPSDGAVIPMQSRSALRSSTSKADTPCGTEAATEAVGAILSCYPDYGKAPPEYIVNIIDVVASYPPRVLPVLSNLRTGIPGRFSYLPSVADIVKMADDFLQNEVENRAVEARVYVTQGTAAQTAWDHHYRIKTGRPSPRDFHGGWWFPSEFPPAIARQDEMNRTTA